MVPEERILEKGLLIVTGSTIRAEQGDRKLAYRLKEEIDKTMAAEGVECHVVVIGDLWYLNAETLHRLPVVSIGGPGVNAVSANLYKRISNALVVDDTLLIQMDMHLEDLRVSIWGTDHDNTVEAVDIFVKRGYLEQFLGAVCTRLA